MKNKTWMWIGSLMVSICIGGVFFSASKVKAGAPAHEYVGAAKCSLCHKKPEQGEQYGIWQGTKHSQAFETLKTPEAKEAAAKLGIDDPTTSGKCLKCHSTAYGFTEEKITEAIAVEEGVSCESCHGPGKDYMKKTVMQDKNLAIENGLIIPDEKTCVKCHNPESPSYKAFDFHEFWEKIKHPVPEK